MSETQPTTKTVENKPLTAAQFAHLNRLNAEKKRLTDQIEAEIRHFVDYLASEYDAFIEQGWTHIDPKLGWVREVKPANTGSEAPPTGPVTP